MKRLSGMIITVTPLTVLLLAPLARQQDVDAATNSIAMQLVSIPFQNNHQDI